MYRFALSRRWIAAHLTVVAFIVACAFLARWQLHRLAEKKAFNAAVTQRAHMPAVPLDTLTSVSTPIAGTAAVAYRPVEVDGTYDTARDFALLGQSMNATAGTDVLTPLVVSPGVAVIVDRGFAPIGNEQGASVSTAPPPGRVHLTGTLLPSEHGFGTAIPRGASPSVSHVDLAKIARATPYRLYPVYVRLASQTPRQPGPYPAPVPVGTIDLGPHLSYAVQWSLFAAVAFFGWIFYLRKVARDRARAFIGGSTTL
jgi:cytochrome oxidase assembly protein ShyY1